MMQMKTETGLKPLFIYWRTMSVHDDDKKCMDTILKNRTKGLLQQLAETVWEINEYVFPHYSCNKDQLQNLIVVVR